MSDKVVNSIIKKLYINPLRKRAAATAAAAKAEKTSKVNNNDKKIDAMIKNLFESNTKESVKTLSNSEVNSFINSIFNTRPVKKTSTLKRKRNTNSNISEPQLKKARFALENVEKKIKKLENPNINSLFSKLSLKNTSVKTRASKAAVTRKLNKLKEQEESLKLILKARTRYQLKKLDLTHSSKF